MVHLLHRLYGVDAPEGRHEPVCTSILQTLRPHRAPGVTLPWTRLYPQHNDLDRWTVDRQTELPIIYIMICSNIALLKL